jgi:hypothetical protein
MSWCVYAVGTPKNVCDFLSQHMAGQTGQSADEYNAAKPHLIGLVEQNFVKLDKCTWAKSEPTIKLEAAGSGSKHGDEIVSQSASCKIEVLTPSC